MSHLISNYIIESLDSTKDELCSCRTLSSSGNKIDPRETVAWILVVILAVLLIISLAIHMMQATCAYRRNNKNISPAATESALAMDSNPCYEASNVNQTEAKEVHVYEMVQQNK